MAKSKPAELKALTASQWSTIHAWCRTNRRRIENCSTLNSLNGLVRRNEAEGSMPAGPNVAGVKLEHVLNVCRLMNIKTPS